MRLWARSVPQVRLSWQFSNSTIEIVADRGQVLIPSYPKKETKDLSPVQPSDLQGGWTNGIRRKTGIYVHIPFAGRNAIIAIFIPWSPRSGRQSSRRYTSALRTPGRDRKDCIPVDTVYFGGGPRHARAEQSLRGHEAYQGSTIIFRRGRSDRAQSESAGKVAQRPEKADSTVFR